MSDLAATTSRRPRDGLFYLVAFACGAATGVIGAALHLLVDDLLHWPQWLVQRLGDGWTTIAVGAAISAAAVTLAWVLVRTLAPEAAGSGVQEVEGALEDLRVVRWRRVLPVKFVGGVLALSSGLVGGREGPTIHIGASIGAALAEKLRLDRVDLSTLLACGAAAGLAAAFNAPLAAVLFVIEETRKQFRYTFRSYIAVIVASAASAYGMEMVGGTAPPLRLATHEVPLALMPAFLVLGVALGGLGVIFNKTLLWALEWRTRVFAPVPWLYAVLVGAAIGVLSFVLPLAVGGGETLIPRMVQANLPLHVLLLIAVVRFVGTMASYPVNVPAGIFAPLLAIGTTVGLIAGALADSLLVALPSSVAVQLPPLLGSAFAVSAMAGLFSATIRAPLVGVVLLVELTGAFELILPLMITSVTAHAVAEALGGRPIYEVLLERTLRLAGQVPPPPTERAYAPVGIGDSPPGPSRESR